MKRLTAALALFAAAVAAPVLAAVVPIGDVARGSVVTVQGTVERITDEDEFRLADASGSILIYVGPALVPASVGEVVTVTGLVDDDPGPLEIYAREMTRADGSRVTFRHSDQ
jgi:hypothetical protein